MLVCINQSAHGFLAIVLFNLVFTQVDFMLNSRLVERLMDFWDTFPPSVYHHVLRALRCPSPVWQSFQATQQYLQLHEWNLAGIKKAQMDYNKKVNLLNVWSIPLERSVWN